MGIFSFLGTECVGDVQSVDTTWDEMPQLFPAEKVYAMKVNANMTGNTTCDPIGLPVLMQSGCIDVDDELSVTKSTRYLVEDGKAVAVSYSEQSCLGQQTVTTLFDCDTCYQESEQSQWAFKTFCNESAAEPQTQSSESSGSGAVWVLLFAVLMVLFG